MVNHHNKFLAEALSSTNDFQGCSPEEMHVFQYEFNVKFMTINALMVFKKGTVDPNDLELYSEEQVVRVLQDLNRLKSFVGQIAEDKCPDADEAVRILNSLNNETI